MDRSELELVCALAESGSLTEAARRLHIAQPALSRRLAGLEREVGATLFTRGRHGATPTAVGTTLVERATDALAAIRRAEVDTADAAAGRAGRLRIGTTPTLGADMLPTVLAAVRSARPGLHLELVSSGDSPWLHDEVRAGRLDVAVAVVHPESRSRDAGDALRVAVSGPQTFALVIPADHRFASRRWINRAQLIDEPIVALRGGEGLRIMLDALFAELGVEPAVSIETTEREMLIPFVAAGLGVTIVPEVFARQRAGEGLVVLPLRPALVRRVGVVVRAGPLPAAIEAFVATVRTHLGPSPPMLRR